MASHQIFQIKVNEDKLNSTLDTILRRQNLHQKQIEEMHDLLKENNFKNKVMSYVNPIFEKMELKYEKLLMNNQNAVAQDIFDLDKKYKNICQQNLHKSQKELLQVKQQIKKLTESFTQASEMFSNETLDKIIQNSNKISKCEEAIIASHTSELEFFRNIIQPTQLLKHLKPHKMIQLSLEEDVEQLNLSDDFTQNLQKIKQQTDSLKKKFKQYIQCSNVRGSKQNANLLYTVISDKIEKIEGEILAIKRKEKEENGNRANSLNLLNPYDYCSSEIESRKRWSWRSNQFPQRNVQESTNSLTEEILANKLDHVKKQIKSIIQNQNRILLEECKQLSSQINIVRKNYHKIEEQIRSMRTVTKPKTLIHQNESIPSNMIVSLKNFESQLREKVDTFITKRIFADWQQTLNKKLSDIEYLIKEKAKKKQTRDAMIFMEQKIKDIVVLLSAIQENYSHERKEGTLFKYLSYDQSSLQNKQNTKQPNSCFRPIKSSRLLHRGNSHKREFRKSNGMF